MSVNVGTAIAYLQLDATAFNTGLANAQSALGEWQTGLSRGLTTAGSVLAGTGTALTTGLTVPLVNAAKSAVTFGAEFDKQMSAVRAVMGDISDEEFEKLRQTAIDWGEKTVYTATEAGEALYYMGLAGWDAEQAINGLGSVLNLAAAGQMDLGRASDVVTDSMTAMNLTAGQYTNGIENTAYYTSVLAAVMANSNTDVDMLGESFKYVAPIAGQLGYTIEDLGLALGLSANAGIKSSQAGTSLRQALKQLISPTDRTATAMEKYGISLFDAQGQALPFREIMLQLQKTFGDLGVEVIDSNGELKEGEAVMEEYANSLPISQQEKLQAVVDLFGTRAMPTMLAIIQQAGGEFDKLANAIDDAAKTGEYASEMAHTQMDNLSGDWTRFTSALGTTKIMLKDLVDGWLRDFVQRLTELIQKFNDLSDAQKMNVLRWGAIAAAVGPVMTIFGRIMLTIGQLIPMIKAVVDWFGTMRFALGRLAVGLNGTEINMTTLLGKVGEMGAKANWIIAIIMAVITAIVDLWRNSESFREWVKEAFLSFMRILKTVWGFLQEIFNVLGDVWMSIARAIEPLVAVLVRELSPALEAVLNLLKPIFEILTPIIKILGKIIELILALVTPIVTVLSYLIGLISEFVTNAVRIVGNLFDALKTIIEPALEFLENLFGGWVDSVVEFFKDLKYQLIGDPIVIDLIEGMKSIFQLGLDIIKGFVETFVNAVVDFFTWLKETGSQIISDFIEGLKTTWDNFTRWFEDVWNKFTAWLRNALESARDKIVQGFENFKSTMQRLLESIRDKAQEIFNTIAELAKDMWDRIVNAFEVARQRIQEGIEIVRNKFEELKEVVKQKFDELLQNLKEHFRELSEKIKEFGLNFVEAWKNAFENVQQGIAHVFNVIREGFIKFGTSVFEIAQKVGYAFIQGLLGTGRSIKQFFVEFIRTAIQTFIEKIQAFRETGKLIITAILEGIKNAWKAVTEWFEKAWDSLKNGTLFKGISDWFEGMFTNFGNRLKFGINGSHENGLSYVPYNGYVAELHKGERVLTAEENKRYSNGTSNGTVINFYSNEKIDEYTAAKELRRTVKDIELGLV